MLLLRGCLAVLGNVVLYGWAGISANGEVWWMHNEVIKYIEEAEGQNAEGKKMLNFLVLP